MRPLRLSPAYQITFDDYSPGKIIAKVTNVSGEDQVLVQCKARSANSVFTSMYHHLKHPLKHPRLYQNIWFGPQCFNLLNKESVRLSPQEQKILTHQLSNYPLSLFLNSYMQIEVTLSNGRKFRSKRLKAPERFMFKPHKKKK